MRGAEKDMHARIHPRFTKSKSTSTHHVANAHASSPAQCAQTAHPNTGSVGNAFSFADQSTITSFNLCVDPGYRR